MPSTTFRSAPTHRRRLRRRRRRKGMARSVSPVVLLALLALPVLAAGAAGQEPPQDTIVPRAWLVMPRVDGRGRRPFRPDAVYARHLLQRDAPAPRAGESLAGESGEAAWEAREADADGALDAGGAGWAFASLESATDRVMLAELSGASMLHVNGEAVAGDLYRLGTGGLPVTLRAGSNALYVEGIRGGFRLRLRAPEHALLLGASDLTRPDLLREDGALAPRTFEVGVLLLNATREPMPVPALATGGRGPFARVATPAVFGVLPPLGAVKLPVRVVLAEDAALPGDVEAVELDLHVPAAAGDPPRTESLTLSVRSLDEPYRVTRRSAVDGSVQEFSVRRPASPPADGAAPGLVLTLHGAGVDARGQAASYAPKPGLWIVAPTNRRPFGFDWQDWGRRDAYETLDAALALSGADPARLFLTGHSMGGHGTWHLAVNDPDRFAALAPSAGWAGFDSYGGRPEGALSALWHAADAASGTMALLPNVADLPVYILHGSADDNVPASEAHALEAALRAAGGEPRAHYQEGAGHWWDGPAAAGADCVDWPPIFAMFAEARRDTDPLHCAFVTVDPGVDGRHHWISVFQPLEPGRPLSVTARRDATWGTVELETENVRLLGLHRPEGRGPLTCRLDGHEVTLDDPAGGLVLLRTASGWSVVEGADPDALWSAGGRLDPAEKGPGRTGPFKRAFDNRFVLVRGTAGDDREDAELLARARADASVWWYRGNGRATLVSDEELLSEQGGRACAGRNLILYGNRDTNAAWAAALPEACPVDARRGALSLGGRTWEGEGLGAVFVQPRRGEADALVGVFADTGPAGARLGTTLLPFVSGVGYPDYALFGPDVLRGGDEGVLAAGWFDHRWRLP